MATLKEELFNRDSVTLLGSQISKIDSTFPITEFVQTCLLQFPKQELKERMTQVTKALIEYLPNNYPSNLVLLDEAISNGPNGMFIYGSVLEYIETVGCTEDYLDLSLEYIGIFTKKLSGEFAIRAFLNQFPIKTLSKIMEWSLSEDYHRRRLASEGVRPSLPWAKKINIDYKEGSLSLHNLYYDSERYVTRSVANHLNDISKIDPDFVLNTLLKWRKEDKQDPKELEYIINHSLRTLVKKGHPKTLEFLGYKMDPNIFISGFSLDKSTIHIGDKLGFMCTIKSNENTKLIIDYKVIYPTKLGKTTSKVYKKGVLEVEKDVEYRVSGTRSFKPISTRTFYEGKHRIELQINGKIYASKEFILTKKGE